MYSVHLTNQDGREVYRGDHLSMVMMAAIGTGFECYLMENQDVIMTWSPIGGWRNFHIKQMKC